MNVFTQGQLRDSTQCYSCLEQRRPNTNQPTVFAEKMKGGGFVRAKPQQPDRSVVVLHERH